MLSLSFETMRPGLETRFGQAVRRRREALGISQEALADAAGVHRTYIGSVERGERNISLRNIIRLAAALGCGAADLVAEAESKS
jgi:transcriptional regulator with XRE-family HTH domain